MIALTGPSGCGKTSLLNIASLYVSQVLVTLLLMVQVHRIGMIVKEDCFGRIKHHLFIRIMD